MCLYIILYIWCQTRPSSDRNGYIQWKYFSLAHFDASSRQPETVIGDNKGYQWSLYVYKNMDNTNICWGWDRVGEKPEIQQFGVISAGSF